MIFNETVRCMVKDNGVAIIQIDNPPANSLTRGLFKGLDECLDYLEQYEDLRAVILTGTGKFFVAGGDIKEFLIFKIEDIPGITESGQRTLNRIENLQVPVIGAINGFALGGGLEVSLVCDIRIASEKARFAFPEVTLGLIPGYGGTTRISKAISPGNAKMLLYTGQHINAERAKEIGLIQEVVVPEELMKRSEEIADIIAQNAPIAIREAKRVVNISRGISIEESLKNEGDTMMLVFESEDLKEGAKAFVEKRKAEFKNK